MRRSSSRPLRKSGSTEWANSILDPLVFLTSASPKGASIFVPNGIIQDMTSPTLVHGWIDLAVWIETVTILPASAAYIFVGLRVVPDTLVTVAETPGPFTQADGNWFFHRVFPLAKLSGSNYPNSEGQIGGLTGYAIHEEVKSARVLHEDEKVVLVYELVDADYSGLDVVVYLLANFRYLLRQP